MGSGMIAELPDSDEEVEVIGDNKEGDNSQLIPTSQISQRPSQNSLMTDEEVFENKNGTVVQEMTDDEEEEIISEHDDEAIGNSNEDNIMENIEKMEQKVQNNQEISEDE